jgi:AcrR family transcriptional regulator
MDEPDTKTKLLQAAEVIMAQRGISGTSLREITDAAGVNVALVKYHFGSREKLVEGVLKRHLDPINARRLDLLTAAEARDPAGPLPLEAVLEALIRPAVEKGLSGEKDGVLFLRLFGRIFAEPASAMGLLRKQMGPMIKRFDAAFERALPHLSELDLGWRKMACLGVVQHSLLMLSMMDELPLAMRLPLKLPKGKPKPELVLAQMVAFCAAGMRAGVPEPGSSSFPELSAKPASP